MSMQDEQKTVDSNGLPGMDRDCVQSGEMG